MESGRLLFNLNQLLPMKISDDGFIVDFCCERMEEYSRKPLKAISFDLTWKLYEMADIEPKATIFALDKSGLIVDQGWSGRSVPAGQQPIPINFCCWCGKKIEFSRIVVHNL